MKTGTLLLLMYFSFTCLAQETSKAAPSKWTIGLSGTLNMFAMGQKSAPGTRHYYTYKKNGFRGGVDIGYRFSKWSAISTGLFYFKTEYGLTYIWEFQHSGDPQIPRSTRVNAGYLDIPFIYHNSLIAKNKFTFYTSAGFVSSILTSSSSFTTYADNSVRKFNALNPFLMSAELGLGAQYNFSEKTALRIEPRYRVFLKGFDRAMNQAANAMCFTATLTHSITWKNMFKAKAWNPLP